MRVLLWGLGTRGDLQPLVALAHQLKARGHEAQLIGPPNFQAWVGGQGLAYQSIGSDFEALMRQVRGSELRGARLLVDEILAQFALSDEPVAWADAVIVAGAAVGGTALAEKHGKLVRTVSFAPGNFPSRAWPALGPLAAHQALPRVVNHWTWKLSALGWDALLTRKLNEKRRAVGVPAVKRASRHLFSGSFWLAADPLLAPAAEIDRVAVPELRQLGAFLCPPAQAPLSPSLEAFLAAGEPPICIGFGSVPDAAGVELLRVFERAAELANVRAVVIAGWSALPNTGSSTRLHVLGSAPFEQLFPRVRAVVHHGGAGTLTLAAIAGKPQVIVPQLVDNHYWGARVQALGIGPAPLRRAHLTPQRLARAIRLAIDSPAMVARATALAPQIELQGASAAVRELERSERLVTPA